MALKRTVQPRGFLHLGRTLEVLRRGPHDTGFRQLHEHGYQLAGRTPEGPMSMELVQRDQDIDVTAQGPGAAWAIAQAPTLLGADDDAPSFAPTGRLGELHRRFGGIRILRTERVFEAALRAIVEQLVTGIEAMSSYTAMVKTWGEPAPGAPGLWVPPAPQTLARLPLEALRKLGIDAKRAQALRTVAKYAGKVEQTCRMTPTDASAWLQKLPGIGPWTAAEIAVIAWGDADAVSVGDYHLKNVVSFAFTGAPRGTDDEMLALLEPFRPHRARVVRLLHAAGIKAPRFGPRRPLRGRGP